MLVHPSLQASQTGSHHGLIGILCPKLENINNPKKLQSFVLIGDVARPQFNAGLKKHSVAIRGTLSLKTYSEMLFIILVC